MRLSGGIRISELGGGGAERQHILRPNIPKKHMKMRKIETQASSQIVCVDPPLCPQSNIDI